jgi:hypothetical protein
MSSVHLLRMLIWRDALLSTFQTETNGFSSSCSVQKTRKLSKRTLYLVLGTFLPIYFAFFFLQHIPTSCLRVPVLFPHFIPPSLTLSVFLIAMVFISSPLSLFFFPLHFLDPLFASENEQLISSLF